MDTTIYLAAVVILILILIAFFVFKNRQSYQIKIMNEYRRKHHLGPLKAYHQLNRFAREHSRYMARHRACNHDRFPDRSARVMQVTGAAFVGENCYMYPSPTYDKYTDIRLVEGWMESPDHRANILNPRYSRIGIGVVIKERRVYATQIFCSE